VYGYPAKQAAGIAVRELLAGLVRHETIETVRLVLFSDELLETFRAALAELR
jgi:O-acetyl-ADP-ribose deacetylase (regulator of RNase III)